MNIKDEHTSRLWTFIMKGEIMDLDDDELIATRINNKTASWKEVEEYIEKYYVKKDKIKEFLSDKITYRQFELQQEYRDFEDDIKLNTLQDIKKELLGE